MGSVNVIRMAEVRSAALSVDEVLTAVNDPQAGGIALFAGVVRVSFEIPDARNVELVAKIVLLRVQHGMLLFLHYGYSCSSIWTVQSRCARR